jgi:DNA polymerase
VLVALGATAAQSLLGRQFRVTKERGKPVGSDLAPYVVATVHPSSILRQETEGDREAAMKDFVADLEVVAELLRSTG